MNHRCDMFYRGGRSYIQGSLIASSAARWFSGAGGQVPVILERIRFKRISNGHLVLSDEPTGKVEALGDIILHRDGERHRLFLAEVQGEDPPRHPDDASRLQSYTFDGPLCCHAMARPPADLDDLLAAVVETVKRCVGETYPGAEDIWFVGLQDSTIGTSGPAYDGNSFQIIATDGMANDQGDRRMTRHSLSLVFDSGDGWTANIIFACRLPPKA